MQDANNPQQINQEARNALINQIDYGKYEWLELDLDLEECASQQDFNCQRDVAMLGVSSIMIHSESELSSPNELFEGGDRSNSHEQGPNNESHHFQQQQQFINSGTQEIRIPTLGDEFQQNTGYTNGISQAQMNQDQIRRQLETNKEKIEQSRNPDKISRLNQELNSSQLRAARSLNLENFKQLGQIPQQSRKSNYEKRIGICSPLTPRQKQDSSVATGKNANQQVKTSVREYENQSIPQMNQLLSPQSNKQGQHDIKMNEKSSLHTSGNLKTPNNHQTFDNIQTSNEQHQLTSIASFGQIQHQRLKSMHSSKQSQLNNDYEDSQRDNNKNNEVSQRSLQSSSKRDNLLRLQALLGARNGLNTENSSQSTLMKANTAAFAQMSSELKQTRTQDMQQITTSSKLGSMPASSKIAIKMTQNANRQKNLKSFGQATERSNLTSLNSQQILDIQQNMIQIGVKRNSRVNSQIFNEQQMAVIEAANGIIQQQAHSGVNTVEASPDHNQEPNRSEQESPKKIKLTLKGDNYIQKFQKPRDEGSDYQQSIIQNENSEAVNLQQQMELRYQKRLSQNSYMKGTGMQDDLNATPKSPLSINMNDISDISAKKLSQEGQSLNLNSSILQKLGSSHIVSAKRGTEASGKQGNNFAPIISKEQIKFYKNAATNRDKDTRGNDTIDQSQVVNINSGQNETSVSARITSSKNFQLNQQRFQDGQNQQLNNITQSSGFPAGQEASPVPQQNSTSLDHPSNSSRRHHMPSGSTSIPIKSPNSQKVDNLQNINLNKVTVNNRKGVQKQTSHNTSTIGMGDFAPGQGSTNNTQIIIGQSLLSKRSQQNQIINTNITLRSQSSQNSGGVNGFAAGVGAVHGPLVSGTLGGGQSSYRGDQNNSMHKNMHKMSPDVKGIATIISEHQQDPYAFYILNQNKIKQNGSANTTGLQSNTGTQINSGPGSVHNQPNFQINVKSQSQTNNDQQIKKLGTQLISSAEGPSHIQDNQGQFEEGSQKNFEMGVKSCRPNLYNKHRLIISQRGGAAPYQLALVANKNNFPGTHEAMLGQNQFMGSNFVPLCGNGIPQIESGSRDISNMNSQSTGPRRHEANTRQQSLEKHIQLLHEMQASGRTSGVGGTQQFINFGSRPGINGIPSQGSHQQKSFDLHDSNKKNHAVRQQYKHIMSPGGGTVFVQGQDQNLYRRIDERQILSGAVDGRNRGINNLTNNYHENYYQNQSLTSNNERLNAKKGFVKFSGSGSHGSNFNSSVSTFPAAPIQKLSDVKNPQKLLTFRFVNRRVTKISEIQLFKNLRELDLTGNMLQEVKELNSLNFLKNLNLSYNKIQQLWMLPKRIEILNLAHNQIKSMPEDICKNLRNVTTIDVSSNKLESLENFQYMHRIKRLVAKNNFIRQIAQIKSIENIYELDLEGNAVDSHIDFLEFIKGKNDLIIINLHLNPIMVEVDSIEKINEDLISKAPDKITRKTKEEIEEFKELMGINNNQILQNLSEMPATPHSINNKSQSNSVDGQVQNPNNTSGLHQKRPSGVHSTPGNDVENSNRKGAHLADDDTNRFYNKLHLIKELADCLTYLKNGVLYRNKRVFNRIRQIQQQTKRSISNYSNSSHSAAAINQSLHYQQSMSQNNVQPGGGPTSVSGAAQHTASGSSRNLMARQKPSNDGVHHQDRDGSSQGKPNYTVSNKLSPMNTIANMKPMGSGENNHIPRPQVTNPMTGKPYGQKNNLSNSIGYSPIVSKKSHRYEDIENLYDYIVEQEELKRLKQQKIFAKRRKQKRKQMMSHIGTGVNNSEVVDGASPSQNQSQYPQQYNESSDDNNSSDDFTDDDIDDDDDYYFDDLENSRDMNFIDQQKQIVAMGQAQEDADRIAMLKAGRLPSSEIDDMHRYLNIVNAFNKNGEGAMDESSCIIAQNSSRILNNSYHMQNYQYHQHLHDDDAVSQTITSDLDADLHSYPYKKVELNLELEALYDPNNEPNYQQNGSQIDDNDYLNGSTAGFGKKLREINREINQEQLDSLAEQSNHHLNSKGVLIMKESHRDSHMNSIQLSSQSHQANKLQSQSAQKARIQNLNVPPTTNTNKTKQKLNLNLSKITIDQENLKSSPQKQRKIKSDVQAIQKAQDRLDKEENVQTVQNASKGIKKEKSQSKHLERTKDSHLTQSDIKLKKQLALYNGEEQESPEVTNKSQVKGTEEGQPREGVQSELKIDQRIIDELNINRKKQIKTVQNSNESSQESDSQVGSVDHLGLNIGKGLLKGTNSKNEIGICTITNSNSDKHTTGNQQQLNQSFSLKNIQIAGDASQQHEVESLMMQIIERGPQAMHNEFSAKNENYAAAYNMLQVAGQNLPFNSLRNGEGLAGMSNINSQKYNSIMQASLSQNIDAPEFLKKPSTANLDNKVIQSEQQSHTMLDDSMAQSGLSFTQNSKKNMHPHFKLDLSKCIDYNDDYIEANSAQSSEQKLGSNFLDDIKQPSQQQDIENNSNTQQIQLDQIVLNECNLDNIETVKIEISKQNYPNKIEPTSKASAISTSMKSLRDKIKISSRRSTSKQDMQPNNKADAATDKKDKGSQKQAVSKTSNRNQNQKSPMIIKKFNLSKDYQQKEVVKMKSSDQVVQQANGHNATNSMAKRESDHGSNDLSSDAPMAVNQQNLQRTNMTERDPTPALQKSQLNPSQNPSQEITNVQNLNALKPPLEENNSKVKTERHTKTPGQNNKLKGMIQLSNQKNKKGEILLQIPQSKIQRYNLENGTKLRLPGSEIAQNGTPKMGGSSSTNQCNECQIYQRIIQSLKEEHHIQLEQAKQTAHCYRQQLLDIKDYLCINGELQDLFQHDHAKSAGNRQIRITDFASIVQQFFQNFRQELDLLEKENSRQQQNIMFYQQIASGDLSSEQKLDLEEINKIQKKDIIHQKTRQSIKIPNIDQMEIRTHQVLSNVNVSLNSNLGAARLQQPPKTITSRQGNKRKSLERSGMVTSSIVERTDSQTRNNDDVQYKGYVIANSQSQSHSQHVPDNQNQDISNFIIPKSQSNVFNPDQQYSMTKDNANSEGQRVQRKQTSLNANHMNTSYTHGQQITQPDVDQMNFELGDNHKVQLQELEEGDSIAQYVVAQLQNRNSDALDIKTVFTNRNTLEPTQKTSGIAQELCNSNLISIDVFERACHAQSQNTSQLQTGQAHVAAPSQKIIQLTSKGEREYEQNTFSQSSHHHLTKLYTNRNMRGENIISNPLLQQQQQQSFANSAHPKHLRQRGTHAGISGRHGGTVEDCRSVHPPILSQQTSLQTSSVQLNDKKIIIQKQNMLSQNLSVNTNIEAVASSSFNVCGGNNNNTVNVSMIVGGSKHSGVGSAHHNHNKKIKSQRACHVKLLQQQVNNYTGGNIINELNNLQLIQQQLMRNKSNTSRGTKGSAQYKEQLLNLNQTSQSSINPQNYLTSKRKSPKLAQKLKVQKQLQNIMGDEQKMQQLVSMQQIYLLSQQSQQQAPNQQMTPQGQLYPDNTYHLEVAAAGQQQPQMAIIAGSNGIGMTIIDPRNGAAIDHSSGNGGALKAKKTSSVNSRTAKENWKSLQQSAQQVQSMDFSGKTGKKAVNKIVDNQKSLERIVAYQSSGTQYKTSRLPLSNQKMTEGHEHATNASGTGASGYHRNEVFLSQPQQSKKSQSQYQANRDSTVNSGSMGLSNKAPHSGTANSKNRLNLSSMGPAGKYNQRQSYGDQRSLVGSDNNVIQEHMDIDPNGNMVAGGTQDPTRQRVLEAAISQAGAPIPDDTTFGYNGSCEVKLLAQNLEHVQPSYYTQRKLLNPKPTAQAPIPGSSTANASSSQSKNVLLSLQNQKQQSFQQQHQYSLQKSTNQQYQINVMKQKNKFLETRSKSIQRNQDSRQVVASGYSQLLEHMPNFSGTNASIQQSGLMSAAPASTIATAGNQSRQKLSNKCSNAQVHQLSTDGVTKFVQDNSVKFNALGSSNQQSNNNKNLRGQSINLLISGSASSEVPGGTAALQLFNKYPPPQQQQQVGTISSHAARPGGQANAANLQHQDSVESTSNKKPLNQNDIVIYSANSGKRPQSVVEVGGRRFQKGGVSGHGQGHQKGAWPQLMAKGAFTNTHGGGSLVAGGHPKKERKGRGKSSDQKNNKTVYLKNSKQLQAKNSLNTTDINQFNLFDMNKKIEQNIQKIQQIQNAKQQQIQRTKEMASNRDSDINIRQQVQILQQHQNSIRIQSLQSPHVENSTE